jgi:hypothetical protein
MTSTLQFGRFYCHLYVESICIRCLETVVRAPTEKDFKQAEAAHRCLGKPGLAKGLPQGEGPSNN